MIIQLILETAKEIKTIPLESQVSIISDPKINGSHVSTIIKKERSVGHSIIKKTQKSNAKIEKKRLVV